MWQAKRKGRIVIEFSATGSAWIKPGCGAIHIGTNCTSHSLEDGLACEIT
jgi:hypothetical protein